MEIILTTDIFLQSDLDFIKSDIKIKVKSEDQLTLLITHVKIYKRYRLTWIE